MTAWKCTQWVHVTTVLEIWHDKPNIKCMYTSVKYTIIVSDGAKHWRYYSLALNHRYHTCRLPGDPMTQDVSSHSVDIIILQLFVQKTIQVLIVSMVPISSTMMFSKQYWCVTFLCFSSLKWYWSKWNTRRILWLLRLWPIASPGISNMNKCLVFYEDWFQLPSQT